jgi:hypothetical protein
MRALWRSSLRFRVNRSRNNWEACVITFPVNGKTASFDDDPSTPLLWVLRDNLQVTGTKYGCGMRAAARAVDA